MNAETLLDSMKVRKALDELSATWRSKRTTDMTRTLAFQDLLDLISMSYNLNTGSSKGRTPGFDPGNGGSSPSPVKPTLKAKPEMDVFTKPEEAGIETFDPFRHPEEQENVNPIHSMLLKAHETTKDKPAGAMVVWKLPEDFNPNRTQQYLNELGLPYNVIDGGTSLDTTLSMSDRPENAPAPGWLVQLQKAE